MPNEEVRPLRKLSKKQKRVLDLRRRKGWGSLNPVTRVAPKGKKPPDYEKHPEAYEGVRIK